MRAWPTLQIKIYPFVMFEPALIIDYAENLYKAAKGRAETSLNIASRIRKISEKIPATLGISKQYFSIRPAHGQADQAASSTASRKNKPVPAIFRTRFIVDPPQPGTWVSFTQDLMK